MAARVTIYAFFLLVCFILKANQAASQVNISTDESALLSFKAQITSDPNGILAKNWTKGTTVCSWIGISCSQRHQRVTTLVLKSLQLSGTIAKEMGSLSFLSYLEIGNNSFHGEIPQELGRLTRLKYLSLQMNNLTGEIPASIGLLRRLELLDLSDNDLLGSVPLSIFNVSSLKVIDMNWNDLSGTLPNNICNNLPYLRLLSIGRNQLSGQLPSGFGRCKDLQLIALSYNQFTGSLPRDIWNSTTLQTLLLGWNNFTGNIPSEIENLSSVQSLSLRRSNLGGLLPPSIGNLSNLEMIDLGYNHLHGNLLSGQIPSTIGQLQNLVTLSLSMNRIHGPIPESFKDLASLEYLDLSGNNLSGPFINFTAESFIGNTALCGESRYQVMACSVDNSPKRTTKKMALIISVLASVFVLAALLLSIFVIWLMKWRKSRQLPLNISYFQSHKRICYYEIVRGTNNFDEANLIGKGGLGLVYKGILADGLVIAIKVFNTEVQDAFIRFDLECRVLRNIRHRNLVKVISSVSSLDFKALVLEYMSNGNLDSWLYSHNYFLDLIQRIKVMIDVASAMEYLHEGQYSSVVVHCDLKPSNILLDGDMVARVSDFGISKLLTADNLIAHTKTLGTIGYMAPEYGSESMVSTKGDVYSFGILLMETFTRKKPMDDLFVGDLTLKRWVLQSFPNRLVDVVDANLFSRHEENFTSKESCFQLIMELALNCTVDIPEERINMKDVLVRLKKILAQYLKDITTN